MFCVNCGSRLIDGKPFCPNCGTRAEAQGAAVYERPKPAPYPGDVNTAGTKSDAYAMYQNKGTYQAPSPAVFPGDAAARSESGAYQAPVDAPVFVAPPVKAPEKPVTDEAGKEWL